jgi:TonB family protein
MKAVSLMVHKILKPCLDMQFSFLFALSALLLPGIASSQSAENPAFTVIAIEVDGKSVSSAPGIISYRYEQSSDAKRTGISLKDAISGGSITTPANTVVTLRSLNGNTIRLLGDSRIAGSRVHRAGERYSLEAGGAEFDVIAPLGFFQINNAKITVTASEAKIHLQRLGGKDGSELQIDVLRGKATVQRLFQLSIADTSEKPLVRMAETLSPLAAGEPSVRFDYKKNVPMQFATTSEAIQFFKNRLDAATKLNDDERIAEVLQAQADLFMTLGKYREAIEVLEKRLASTAGDNIAQYDSRVRIANAFIALKEDNRAIPYLHSALKIINGSFSSGTKDAHSSIYKLLSEAYLRLGDTAAATRYSNLYVGADQKYGAPTYNKAVRTAVDVVTFPKKMRQWGLDGGVEVDGIITTDGVFDNLRIAKSIHPGFEATAIRAMLSMRFKPATIEGKDIPASVRIPFNFRLTPDSNSIEPRSKSYTSEHAAFSFPKVNSRAPAEAQYDVAPEIMVVSLPAYPRAQLIDRTAGSAKITVVLDQLGAVQEAEVIEATHPDFGAATKAMMQNWEFAPALKAGRPIPVKFTYEHQFQFNQRDNGISDETLTALRTLKSYPDEIYAADALDAKPKILYQPQAFDPRKIYPSGASVDTVQIEFIIDREGGVQMPRIVAATNMDLAWSVATVLPRWLFEVPKIKGNPVFTRKEVIFEFK